MGLGLLGSYIGVAKKCMNLFMVWSYSVLYCLPICLYLATGMPIPQPFFGQREGADADSEARRDRHGLDLSRPNGRNTKWYSIPFAGGATLATKTTTTMLWHLYLAG